MIHYTFLELNQIINQCKSFSDIKELNSYLAEHYNRYPSHEVFTLIERINHVSRCIVLDLKIRKHE